MRVLRKPLQFKGLCRFLIALHSLGGLFVVETVARGGLIGKSFLFALAAAGQAGVTRALEIIREELRVTLALTGTTDVSSASGHMLRLLVR